MKIASLVRFATSSRIDAGHHHVTFRALDLKQCIFFSRNIRYVTPNIIYLYYKKKILDQSIQKIFYLFLKTEVLILTGSSMLSQIYDLQKVPPAIARLAVLRDRLQVIEQPSRSRWKKNVAGLISQGATVGVGDGLLDSKPSGARSKLDMFFYKNTAFARCEPELKARLRTLWICLHFRLDYYYQR